MNTETYQARITCDNCRFQFTADIPNSKTIHDWVLENYVCPNCNCFLRHGLDPIALDLGNWYRGHKWRTLLVESFPVWAFAIASLLIYFLV